MKKAHLLVGAGLAPAVLAFSSAARAETIVAVTQFNYDDEEWLQCTAVRMNPSTFSGALPDACTLGTQGADGPDRITKNSYDAAGHLTQVWQGYGTPLQQANVTYTYSVTGKQTSVTDANGNKASYTYDGFDRLTQWNFPDKVTAGAVSATDYEAYGYDADGNRTSLRKRDGQTISYSYDALNRMTLKDVPGTTDDVSYGYDLLGAQLNVRFASTGLGITNTFDGLSRLKSTTNNMGTTTRTLNYQYDEAGNRKQLTYPDGSSFVTYVYDALNRLTTIKEAGTTAIVSTNYDAQGRIGSQTRGGVTITLGYDGMSRPISWNDNLAGTTDDVTSTFGYNSANQIKTKTRTNTAYAFAGYVPVNRPYGVNGLNQYTTAGPATFGYDNNGNLTGDGTNVYTYDVENRMKTATVGGVGVTLNYDPLGRLWQVVTPAQTLELTHDGDAIVMEVSGGSLLKYVHGPGDDDPMIQYTASGYGGRQSLESDYQGSIVSVADASGAKVAINAYDDYGIGSGNYGRFQYTGQAWLTQLGLYYYKARMYSPSLGRFMQTDPIGYKDQINLYAYVGNDPIDGTDPTGLCDRDPSGECIVHTSLYLSRNAAEVGFAVGKVQPVVREIDHLIRNLDPKTKYSITGDRGQLLGVMTGKQIQRNWERQDFTVSDKDFGDVNGGVGVSDKGHITFGMKGVEGWYANGGGDKGIAYIILHDFGHDTPLGRQSYSAELHAFRKRTGSNEGFYAETLIGGYKTFIHPETIANERVANSVAKSVAGYLHQPIASQPYGGVP